MAEREDEAYLRRRVRLLGGVCEKLAPTTAGMPDRMVLLPGGRIYLVEMKQRTGTLSPVQLVWHARADSLGTPVYTLYGKEDVDLWLDLVESH